MTNALRCCCGHDAEAHEHFRAGSECGICTGCRRFSRSDPDTVLLPGVAWNRLRPSDAGLSRRPRTPAR